jgi:hypothetical protein
MRWLNRFVTVFIILCPLCWLPCLVMWQTGDWS